MFLKSVELFGFKSFADRSRLDFSSGITALLGPNGCGKSNIVDSIKWVLGEQSMKTLRAGKTEDVIFNGTESRKALNVAEVTLIISNESGFLPMDLPEISIKRRVHRSGESEYFINNELVRLREIKELFFDTGIGKSAYSILEQGKIDQILSQKPEDRRYIFEEAAGITRYKQKSQEAGRKLQRTEENLQQVEQIMHEVKRTYDSRKAQAHKAERYRLLQEKIFETEIFLQLSRVHELSLKKDGKVTSLHASVDEYTQLQQVINSVNEKIEELLDQIDALSNERIDIQNRLHRIDESKSSKKHQMKLFFDQIQGYQKSVSELSARRERLLERKSRDESEIDEISERHMKLKDELDSIQSDIETFSESIGAAEERISSNMRSIQDAEKQIRRYDAEQLQLRKDLQSIVEFMVSEIDAKITDSGYSHAQRKQTEKKIEELIDSMLVSVAGRCDILDDRQKMASTSGQYQKGLFDAMAADLAALRSSLQQLQGLYGQHLSEIPAFIDELLSPAGTLTRKRKIDDRVDFLYDEIEREKERADKLSAENVSLNRKLQNYRETQEHLRLTEVDINGRLRNIENMMTAQFKALKDLETNLEEIDHDLQQAHEYQKEAQENIEELEAASVQMSEEEKDLSLRSEQLQSLMDQKSRSVAENRSGLAQSTQLMSNISQRIERSKAEIDALESENSYIYHTFEENYSNSLSEFEDRIPELDQSQEEYRGLLKSLRSQLQDLGYINHMAAEEFAEVKERYEFLKKQITDLETAKNDLKAVTEEIRRRSEELFEECYSKIKRNFHVMFRRLFGGGRAELRLVDPDHILTSGIDILAQPPGKKLEKITLLSGGERSMTAVALLFATYLVKPSPFCILDEIDAALDDANIGYFLEVLHEFSENSQFIIITHNKRTVLGSSTLLGVTMQEAGVSKAISYRIGEERDRAVIYEDG